jgi:hypothetical protein
MPNAISVDGQFRQILPTPIPHQMPGFHAVVFADSVVELQWTSSAETYGLTFHLYRNGQPIAETTAFQFTDSTANIGTNRYTLILENNAGQKSSPILLEVEVPPPVPLQKIAGFTAESLPGCVRLHWNNNTGSDKVICRYEMMRCENSDENNSTDTEKQWELLTAEPVSAITFDDTSGEPEKVYCYRIRPVSRRGESGGYSDVLEIAAKSVPKKILFESALKNEPAAQLSDGSTITGTLQGEAKLTDESLNIAVNGQLVFPNRTEYNLDRQLTVEFRAKIDEATKMPVLISFGRWNESGWFVQNINNRWRWYLNGVHCDGGNITAGQWTHLVCRYDGKTLQIIQDGKTVAEQTVRIRKSPSWTGSLLIGNYSGGIGEPYQLKGSVADVRITNYVE